MDNAKRKALRNWLTGLLAISGLLFAIANSISGYFHATEFDPQHQLQSAILAVLSSLWLYVLFSSIYHENALDEVYKKIAELGNDEISQGRLEAIVLAKIDKKLRPMFQQHLRSVFAELSAAYETQTVTFSDPLKFKSYYLAVLRTFPVGATLIATSLATKEYFWDGNIESRMGEFIQRRGKSGIKFQRIFYVFQNVFSDIKNLSEEQIAIFRRQLDAGIDVYIYPCEKYPQKFVLADGDATVAWVVETNDDRTIRQVTATSNTSEVQAHSEALQNILTIAKKVSANDLDSCTTAPA